MQYRSPERRSPSPAFDRRRGRPLRAEWKFETTAAFRLSFRISIRRVGESARTAADGRTLYWVGFVLLIFTRASLPTPLSASQRFPALSMSMFRTVPPPLGIGQV